MLKNIIRALRLPFLSASVLPFVFGSLIQKHNFNLPGFFWGLIAVTGTHLSANLINDYADSKSGVDWQDRNFYGFFGGSKLIQEKVFSEKFYLHLAICFVLVSAVAIILLAFNLGDFSVIGFYITIIILSWAYSRGPLRFSYRKIGELFIFILFGPVCVMGGYFIQTKIFPDLRSFILSLPFGFLTTAILFANEVPDFTEDRKAGKYTWVSITGQKYAFLLFDLLIILAFFSVYIAIAWGYINFIALYSFVFIIIAFRAANILRKYYNDKLRLVESSKLTIALQTLVSIFLILSIIR
jgi:1,4-dihydroxy-2-naphthoate octaprenyltransferase